MGRRATLKDVARLAGVSTATVARVLHNKGYVAPATRRMVEDALVDTGYQINALAQGLRRQRTLTIGHVVHSFIPNQFFAAVAVGVEEVAVRNGCTVLVINTYGEFERERRAVETLIQRRVEAIVFTTATHVDNVRLAISSGVPVVQVERMTSADTLAVTADNFAGAYAATEHLVRLGHRRTAFIGVDPEAMRSRPGSATHPDVEHDRLSGYRKALRNHRIHADDDLIELEPNYLQDPSGQERPGYRPMNRLLELRDRPTAIFATFDLFAAAAIQAIHERSLRIPEDISVVGFDDTYAQFLSPPLTAVEHPMVEMGRTAAGLVFQVLNEQGGASHHQIVQLPMDVRVRESTAPPLQQDHIHMSSMTPSRSSPEADVADPVSNPE